MLFKIYCKQTKGSRFPLENVHIEVIPCIGIENQMYFLKNQLICV